MPISCLYYISYRVAVGHLGTNTIQQLNLSMAISCLYCINYRVGVGLLGDEAHVKAFIVTGLLRLALH